MKVFELGPVVQERCCLNILSYLELWRPFCTTEWNHLCNFGRVHRVKQFCESFGIWTSGPGADVF